MSSVHSNNCYWLRWLLSLKHYWSDHSSSTSLISRQCGECEGVRLEPGPAWVLSNIFMLQLHFFRNYWSFWVTFRLSWAQFFPQHSPHNLSHLSLGWEDTSKPSLEDVTLNISPLGTKVIFDWSLLLKCLIATGPFCKNAWSGLVAMVYVVATRGKLLKGTSREEAFLQKRPVAIKHFCDRDQSRSQITTSNYILANDTWQHWFKRGNLSHIRSIREQDDDRIFQLLPVSLIVNWLSVEWNRCEQWTQNVKEYENSSDHY